MFHYFDRFLAEYESRFEKEYGFFRPIVKEVVERYLDCGNPRCGFARIRCPDCGEERLLMFSCRTRGFCPSCHARRLEEWGEWMGEELLLDVPHRQVVFTIPRMLIPDRGQVTIRYSGLYANAHRGKLRKASLEAFPLRMMEEELRPIPAKGWAEMMRKVYEVDPMVCPRCAGTMKVIAFLTDHKVVDKIIDHLKLTFVAERPPPPHIAYQEVLMAAEASTEYSS